MNTGWFFYGYGKNLEAQIVFLKFATVLFWFIFINPSFQRYAFWENAEKCEACYLPSKESENLIP